jgi:alpha-ketoglutarate-dependent taurine dioxygenase
MLLMAPTAAHGLADLADQATRKGWAVGRLSRWHIEPAAASLGWLQVENRRGDAGSTILRPTLVPQAHPASLSALVGSGQQPLHSDGAHLRRPPRWVVIHAEQPNAKPTLLCRLRRSEGGSGGATVPAAARGGVFLVTNGQDRFLAALHDDALGWRWDPGCMQPGDERAHQAADFLASLSQEIERHEWAESNQVLLIDNRQVLHARADATTEPERLLTRLSYDLAYQ